MAWPYLFQSNFERGTNGDWDSETDVENVLNIRHYTWLARYGTQNIGPIAPWRGAYAAEWDLVGDTADHTLIEADLDIADLGSGFTRFYLFLGKDFRATADDIFSIFELQGTADAQESIIALKITAATGAVQISTAQASADLVFTGPALPRGRWICIELATTIVVATATGTSQLFIDGVAQAAAVTHAAVNTPVLRGVFGTQDTLATTLGHIFIDDFIFDAATGAARIFPNTDRFPDVIFVTKSTHICLGDSELLNVTLLPGNAATNELKIYDTDNAIVTDDSNIVAHLFNLTAKEPPIDLADVPVHVNRGAYVQLAIETAGIDTSPRAMIHIGRSQGYRSVGRIRQHASNRKPQNLGQE